MKKILSILIVIIFLMPPALSQDLEKKRYQATMISSVPDIDGILDDEAWKEGTWIDDFTQHEPYNGRPVSQRTEFKILFDEDNLYAGFRAFDTSPDSIVNRLTRRDNPDGDLVGIILDSFHDLRTGFLFGVSSSGVKYDQMFINDGETEDASWDPNWWVKTSVNEEGWVAEMKIPFSQLRFEKNSGDTWGLEVARVLYRKNETSFWQHIPKDAPGLVHLFGELSGLEKIKPRKIFDVTPYLVAQTESFKAEPENPFLAKGRFSNVHAGIDAKIGVTNNMTMDLTINPDFGQVEADPSEVNLSAYETFFREKRPFFVEGNNITNFSLGIGDGDIGNDNLFYSRRIGRRPQGDLDLGDDEYANVPTHSTILGAAKLTGKTRDGLSLGFVEAVTAGEYAEVDTDGDRSERQVEPLTNHFVGRVQKDINEGKTIIGGIFTNTYRDLPDELADEMHKTAYTGGIDFTQYFRDKDWMFNFNTAISQVNGSAEVIENTQRSSARYFQRPDNDYRDLDPSRTSLTGNAGKMMIQKMNGHLNVMGTVIWKTPGFEINDMGYLREADQIITLLWAGYNIWEPKSFYRRINFNADVFTFHNFGGDLTARGFEWNASSTLKNYWSVWTGGNIQSSSLSTGMLRGGPSMKTPGRVNGRIGFSTDSRKKLGFEFYTNFNKGFENSSNNYNAGMDISYKPTNYLSVSLGPNYNKSFSELQYVTNKDVMGSKEYIFASIDRKTISASFRVNINISPDLTLQYWGQPFIASGKYYDHKIITSPRATDYADRFHVYTPDQISRVDNDYLVDFDRNGVTDFSFENKDFNVQEFLSNLVVRWEYNPGSSVFLVWSQTRSGSNETGNMDYFNDMGDLFNGDNNKPHNVFLVKFSYRFGLK